MPDAPLETKSYNGRYVGKAQRPDPPWRTVAQIEQDIRRKSYKRRRQWAELLRPPRRETAVRYAEVEEPLTDE